MINFTIFDGKSAAETRNGKRAEFQPEAILIHNWAPGLFKGDVRANANLEGISLLVLDIDEGCSLEAGVKLFSSYKHVIGTSKSHGIEKNGVVADRFRVVLFLDKAATSDAEFKSAWYAAFARWQFIDKACKDSARFFFPCTHLVSVNMEGATFDERFVLPDSARDWSYRATGDKRPEGVPRVKGKLSKATKDFLVDGAAPGEWHGRFFKAAMDFKEQGYDIEDARLKLSAVTGHLDETDEKQLEDVYLNREAKYEPRNIGLINDWPLMITSRNGDYPDRKHPDNLKHMITKLGFKLRFNQMDEAIYNDARLLSDADLNYLWTESKRQGLDVAKEFIAAEISNIAHAATYHPMKQIIESKTWDGADHIGALYKTLTVRGDEDYALYLKKWLTGVVAKLYRPGSQNLVLTFVGAQGIGKSRWFSKLALYERAFGEGACDPGNKDHELRHLTHLIWHIPELDYTTGKRETGALKDYLTRDFVSARPAYARYTREGRSICSFAASVNADEFLIDPSGNRRFMIIPLDAINPNHDVDVQQCFAQAKALFEAGYEYWLNHSEIADLNERNIEFEIRDPLTSFVETLEAGIDPMTVLEICAVAGRTEPTFSDITRMGTALRRKGIKKQRVQMAGVRRWVYMIKNPSVSNRLKVIKPL